MSSSLRPCDFKMGRVLASLQTFSCTYSFDLRLPICNQSASNVRKLADILRQGISSHAKEFKDAKAMIDGNLGDIIMSLQSRLDIICDQSDGESVLTVGAGEEGNDELLTGESFLLLNLQSLRKQCSLSFPQRVFIPWLAGTYICDYLQPSETLEVHKDHCVELMPMDAPVDTSTILEPETEPLSLSAKSFWGVAVPFRSTSSLKSSALNKREIITSQENDKTSAKSDDFNFMPVILILIFAILVGLVLYVIKAS